MSITLNTVPANISNSGTFNVTTSLVEDSTHVNLRIRADIYHEGIIKAVVEKPKGISLFDFSDILKSLTPGLKFARDSGDVAKTGTYGANLITSWSISSGTFDTLTTAAHVINRAQKTAAAGAFIKSNNITVAIGELYVLYVMSYASSGAKIPYYSLPDSEITHGLPYKYIAIDNNFSKLIMPTANGTINIEIGRDDGEFDFTAIAYLLKITTNRTTIGNPLAPYFALFTEVYEDAVGATQTGAVVSSNVLRFVPATETTFSSYVLTGTSSLFASKTKTITKFFTSTPYEYFINFFTEYVETSVYYSKDGGGYSTANIYCVEGWGAVIVNIGELMATVATSLGIYIHAFGLGARVSEIITIYPDTCQIDERVVLEFDGLLGGKEYLAFEGLKDIQYVSTRNYFTGASKNKKPLSYTGVNRQLIETRFKDINNAEYLKSLLLSENVKKLLPLYAAPTDVTVITDQVKIQNSELFTNQIEIEYED